MREITVTADQLYTIRWAISAGHPDQALDVLAALLGETAPPSSALRPPSSVPPSSSLPLRVALVVGHNSRQPGAEAGGPLENISEFQFNNLLSDYLIRVSPPGFEFKRFNRRYQGSYTREIREVYAQVDAWRPDLALELHFNGGAGDYTFQLAARGATTSQSIAREFSAILAGGLGIADKGVKVCGKNDRGGASLYAIAAPTVLLEPFFGDNPAHCEKIADLGIAGLASLYLQGLEAAAPHLS